MSRLTLQSQGLAQVVENHLEDYFQAHDSLEQIKGLYDLILAEFEKPLIQLVLLKTEGNQVKASQILGINRNTLRKKIQHYDLTMPKPER